ncbi:MAG: polyphosphate--glucose phosphotransferase [Candidatus Promineifilaceae bacterium]
MAGSLEAGMHILGIDIGGSGIKGGLVDTASGRLVTDRLRVKTPAGAHPDDVIEKVVYLVKEFDYQGPLGVGFPAVIVDGAMRSAANVAQEWIGFAGRQAMAAATGLAVTLLNDADAAGLAEMRVGAGVGVSGVVIALTLGTGIGSALFIDGKLVPNTELGHVYLRGQRQDAEDYASSRIKDELALGWKAWARRLDKYLEHIEMLLSPQLIILGGGISKDADRFVPLVDIHARLAPAQLRNNAGIVGAALAAAEAA